MKRLCRSPEQILFRLQKPNCSKTVTSIFNPPSVCWSRTKWWGRHSIDTRQECSPFQKVAPVYFSHLDSSLLCPLDLQLPLLFCLPLSKLLSLLEALGQRGAGGGEEVAAVKRRRNRGPGHLPAESTAAIRKGNDCRIAPAHRRGDMTL